MSDLLALHSSRYPALGHRATDFLFSHAQSPLVSLPQSQETNITRGFVIAKPRRRDSKSNRRVCLIYLIVNNSDNSNNNTHHNNSVSYWWSVGKTDCQRNILPGTENILFKFLLKLFSSGVSGDHRFNTTMVGACSSCDMTRVGNLVSLLHSLIVVIILASN